MRSVGSKSFVRSRFTWMALAVLVVLAATAGAAVHVLRPRPMAADTVARDSSPIPSARDFKTLPVYFEQNRGQTDSRVRFLSHGPGYTVFLTGQGTVLALRKVTALPQPASHPKNGAKPQSDQVKITTASVWMNLSGARADAEVEGIDPLPGRVNYFIGNDSTKWHSDIPTYARVKYRSVYPGIDLIYYGTPQALEYDLIAQPGADPGAIRIELRGADQTRLNPSGDLVISTAAGDLTMLKPRVYQDTANGQRRAIDAHYRVRTAAGKRTVVLALAGHDAGLPLVIDPELVYSSYLGGKGDRSGPIQGFPTLPPQITSLQFSDAAIGLALGPGNTAYVAGLAYSSNFPTTPGAFQTVNQATPNTTPNGFVAKFDTTKSGAASLIYSTYLGGKGCSTTPCKPGIDGDQATAVAVDTSGDAYVGGLTYSDNFPNPNCGAFGTGNNHNAVDNNNGFVAELDAKGSSLIYSCFVHGGDDAAVTGIAIKPGCASNCAAYAAGSTRSAAGDYVVTANAFQTTNPDTNKNSSGYVQVISGDHKSLVYSTFLGGSGTPNGGESLTRDAVDAAGTAYVTGATFSSDFPTQNPFQSSNLAFGAGAQNVVVAHLDPSKSGKASLLYSTYLGGAGLSVPFVGTFGDIAAGIALDSENDVYVAGVAASQNFPTGGIKPAYQPSSNATFGVNGFVTELDTTQTTPAKQLIYSTYIGGTESLFSSPPRPGDVATDVAVDSATDKIFLTGAATTTNFPVSNTCTQMSAINGPADAFVSVLDPDNKPAATQLEFSTYLGGSDIDAGAKVARDSTNKIYVAGVTFSGDFPVTPSAFQFGNNAFAAGTTNAFITKLDTSSTVCPTPFPSPSITATSTAKPTATPTSKPTAKPTATPTSKPTAKPTATPTSKPTAKPTATPTSKPTSKPTATPTSKPTATATAKPTATATAKPTVKPTATGKPTATATRKPTPTATASPTPTATRKPTPTATATIVPGTPHITGIPDTLLVGGNFNITGTGFTNGSVVNFFVATGGPQFKAILTPLLPHGATMMTVHVPDTTPLGTGFASIVVVNTDTGFKMSNPAFALLQGDPAAGVPTIKTINGKPLAVTSADPRYATNNVETVVLQGTKVMLGGAGFDTTNGVAIDLFCACPGGKVGPFKLPHGDPSLTSTLLTFLLPAKGMPMSPATGPGSFVVSNAGATMSFAKKSNAVAVPIGALVHVFSVKQAGSTITVTGSGFSTLTVINFFNRQPDGMVENLGGLDPAGHPEIPLTLLSDTMFMFTVPAGANPDVSYVQAVSPPFVPFSSSGNDPGGSFTLMP